MKDLWPIKRCMECGCLFWAGMPRLGLVTKFVPVRPRLVKKTLFLGFTWKPAWMDHCTAWCAGEAATRELGPPEMWNEPEPEKWEEPELDPRLAKFLEAVGDLPFDEEPDWDAKVTRP